MTFPQTGDAGASFDPLRPRLIRIAYRMLGSVADAEDAVQDAFLRWLGVDRATVGEPEAYLRRVVTRICLDELKSARRQRETYIGPWLPEPVVEAADDEIDDITLPLERAAFLLHDVFGVGFDEVAETIGRDEAACRQLASRARAHVRAQRPRFPMAKDRGLAIAEAFFAATRSGDMQALRSLLATDVALYSDGGGKRAAAKRPLIGLEDVMQFHAALSRRWPRRRSQIVRYGFVNGLPGFVSDENDGLQTTALEIANDRIVGVYVVRNPDKLRRLDGPALH